MGDPKHPEIETIDRIDNSVIIQFKDEEEAAIFPAGMLHASKGIAKILHERDVSEEESEFDGSKGTNAPK